MKPAPFQYYRPTTLEEAVAILELHQGEAKILAGGQSLIPLLNMRLARPRALVDLGGIPGLDTIRLADGALIIGAMARHRAVETSPLVAAHCPILREALEHVGHLAIRSRGTFGGSLAHADPAAEIPAVAALLEATLRVFGPGGWRTVPWQAFFLTYLTTTLGPAEILAEVRLPLPEPQSGWSFVEMARRHGDFALVGVAALVRLDPDRRVQSARLALTGVGATPVRLPAVEQALAGRTPGAELYREAGALAAAGIEPESDLHASAAYRRQLADVLVQRALAAAVARAGGSDQREATA